MIQPIQSLRAYAVLIVLLYHLHIPFFSRGYLGVDVFFSISGFVIYHAFSKRMDDYDRILTFLKGRFFRLAPAYIVVIILTFAWGVTFLLPQDLYNLSVDGLISAIGLINIYYVFVTNYFSVDSDYRPYLHLWSLGVEQQFYLAFAIFMAGTVAIRKKIAGGLHTRSPRLFETCVLCAMFLGSLFASIVLRDVYQPAEFFNPATRAWQFIAGMLAASALSTSLSARTAASTRVFATATIYLTLIVLVYCTIRGASHILIVDQLLIALCVAVISFLATASGARTVFDNRAILWIGLVSYSLYLVHWPLVVFTRFFINRPFEPVEMVALFAATLLAAGLLHYLVEAPWRRWAVRDLIPRTKAVIVAAGLLVITGATANALTFSSADYEQRFAARQVLGERAQLDRYCIRQPRRSGHGVICKVLVGKSAPTVAVMGDSHVLPLLPLLAKQKRANIVIYVSTGCLPLRNVAYINHAQQRLCGKFFDSALDAQPQERMIVLVARWNGYEELVQSKFAIETALAQTVSTAGHRFAIVQQPFEYDQLLPFSAGYRHAGRRPVAKVRPGFFADGVPSLPATVAPPRIAATRPALCALADTQVGPGCFYNKQLGLFYADDNHLLPHVAARLPIGF